MPNIVSDVGVDVGGVDTDDVQLMEASCLLACGRSSPTISRWEGIQAV